MEHQYDWLKRFPAGVNGKSLLTFIMVGFKTKNIFNLICNISKILYITVCTFYNKCDVEMTIM